LLPDAAALKRSRQLGLDAHSRAGDPHFVNPEKGDFRVRVDSSALQVGFENFPMDQFGVVSPRLRALARTPPLTPSQATGQTRRDPALVPWLGARVKNVVGLGLRR